MHLSEPRGLFRFRNHLPRVPLQQSRITERLEGPSLVSGVAFSTCAILDDYSILIYFLPTIRVPEINCNNGRVYKVCGPISDETCSGLVAEPIRTATDLCIEGCYCPNDSALHKDQCIRRSECPCTLRQNLPTGRASAK